MERASLFFRVRRFVRLLRGAWTDSGHPRRITEARGLISRFGDAIPLGIPKTPLELARIPLRCRPWPTQV